MKISDDQNTITGHIRLKFIHSRGYEQVSACDLCALTNHPDCHDMPCTSGKRNDWKEGYYKAEIVE